MADNKEISDNVPSMILAGPPLGSVLLSIYMKSLNSIVESLLVKSAQDLEICEAKNTKKEKLLLQGDVDHLIKWSWCIFIHLNARY